MKQLKTIAKYLFFILITSFIFVSCEKDIEVELPDPEIKLVVEGWIEQNEYAVVILTKNMPYFGITDSASLISMINFPATISLSDGTLTETLNKTLNFKYFPPIIYQGSVIKGEIGKIYHLTVESEGKYLTASATITPPVKFDSLWFELDKDKDSLGTIWAKFTDNAVEKNYYRIFSQRQGRDRKMTPILGSVYDDIFFNGLTFTFNIYRGIESFTDEEGMDNDLEFGRYKIGDTVILKLCTLDKEHYEFWSTAETEFFSGGNPFVNPTPVKTNIKGGGLGIWGGYGARYDTLIIK